MQPCRFYMQSRCSKGAACRFSHADFLTPEQDPRRLLACKFNLKGQCFRGSDCLYSHSTTETTVAETQLDQDKFLRTIGGAIVRFGDGGTVTRLSMVSSFSSVRIDGIPEADATSARFPIVLKDLGHDLLPFETFRAVKGNRGSNASVYITSDDPTFASRFCAEFKTDGRELHVTSVPPRFPPGTITRQISCNKIVASWSRPTRAVFIHYDTYAKAGSVGVGFNRETYTVNGAAVEASTPEYYKGKWRIMLRNTPFDITEARVRNAMHTSFEKPSYIRLGDKVKSYDESAAPAFVASLFKTIGKVEFMTEPRTMGRWWTVTIHFENELHALKAVKDVHGQPHEFLGDGKLTVRLMSASKIKIPRKIHEALRVQIDEVVQAKSQRHRLSTKIFPDTSPESRFITISMQGEDKAHLAVLTGTIENMLSGKVIEVSRETFETILRDGSAAQQLKEIQRSNQIHIMTKKARKELVFFGPSSKYDLVQQAISEISAVKSKFCYRLSENELYWLRMQGFDQIVSALGADIVSYDMSTIPKSLVISGTKQQYQQARAILEGRRARSALEGATPQEETCSTCWTATEDPITLVCGHVYCAECLEDLCKSSTSDDADFKIDCKGANDTCKRVMTLKELETHLSSKAFEEVLQISFASHIRRRADVYHFCPSPDCGFIYTSDKDGEEKKDKVVDEYSTSTCLNCLEVTCKSCHARHGAMSCARYQYEKDGGDEAFDRYKRENGGKDCPKCKSTIEKIEGCNHMICGACGAHICWVCMEVFDTGQECYDHLSATHGGFGIEVLPEQDLEVRRLDVFMRLAVIRGVDVDDDDELIAFARMRLAQGRRIPVVINAMVEHAG